MKKTLFPILLVCLTSALFAQNLSMFEDIYFYKDIRKITKTLSDSSSDFYFEKVIKKYSKNPKDFNTGNEKVLLLYAGIFHNGYQNDKLDSLEDRAQDYLDSGLIDNAIKLSKTCLEVFPVSLKANQVLWQAYDKMEKEDSSTYYFDRLNVLFLGMMKAGSIIGDDKRPTLAYDANSIETYLGTVVPGKQDLFEKKIDRKGNVIMKYRNGIADITFIIPGK